MRMPGNDDVAIALAAAVLLSGRVISPRRGGRETPIQSYSAVPSTTQAGGHPDVLIHFKVENRFQQQSQSACNCEDIKDASVHLPTGLIGNPQRHPQMQMADFSADECPVDSVIGAVEVERREQRLHRRPLQPRAATRRRRPVGFKLGLFEHPSSPISRADRERLRPGREDDVRNLPRLDARCQRPSRSSGGSRRTRGTTRCASTPRTPSSSRMRLRAHSATPKAKPAPTTPIPFGKSCESTSLRRLLEQPGDPFLQNPTTCATPLEHRLESLSYDGGTSTAPTAPWPQMTGCYQLELQPEPLREADDRPDRLRHRASTSTSTVPQPLSPDVPSPSELRAST